MQYLDYPWRVATASSRRPTPTVFKHLRTYPALIEQHVKITDPTQIQDPETLLASLANLYLSNEIKYVIAQILGLAGDKFETIKSDGSGALHVYLTGIAAAAKQPVTVADGDDVAQGALADAIVAAGAAGTVSAKLRRLTQGVEDLKTLVVLAAGTNKIGNVSITGPSQTMERAQIHGSGGGDVLSITGVGGHKHKITSIVLVVAGDTDITFLSAGNAISGPMPLGGTDEPRGMTINHGNFPLECGTNEAFVVHSSAAVQVSGYVVYYDEA